MVQALEDGAADGGEVQVEVGAAGLVSAGLVLAVAEEEVEVGAGDGDVSPRLFFSFSR